MKFGIFYEISVPRPWDRETEKRVYDNCLEQVVLADELGFDQVWAVEHHRQRHLGRCEGHSAIHWHRRHSIFRDCRLVGVESLFSSYNR